MLPNKDVDIKNFPLSEPEHLTLPSQKDGTLSLTSQTLSNISSNVIIKTHIKYGNKSMAYKAILAEYCKSSSIHGIRYIFGIHRPLYERIYWIVFLLISLYFAITQISSTYLKWLESPVIIGFDETLVPIYKIPFPTVTICPEIKIDRTKFNFSQVYQKIWQEIEIYKKFENFNNITQQDLQYFASALQICENEVIDRFAPYISNDIPLNVSGNLYNITVETQHTIKFCKWNNRRYGGNNLFTYISTDEGFCHQFNGLQANDIYRNPKFLSFIDYTKIDYNKFKTVRYRYLSTHNQISGNWSLNDGYMNQGINAYPQRSISTSARNALSVFMVGLNTNLDYSCRSFRQGYKIFLNSPESVPLTSGNYILVPHGKEVLVKIIPQYIKSSKNLQQFSPEKRQCYFNDERYLSFFKTYSQNNCQTECLTNFTISKCGCAKFWMPKPLGTRVCNLVDVKCYRKAADELNLIIANQMKQKLNDSKVQIMCDCMPSCNSLDYNFEISQTVFDSGKTLQAFGIKNFDRTSRFGIQFKEAQFTAIKRTVVYGLTTLIANCGGIFGLFMGISALSIIEFFISFQCVYTII